MAVSNYTNRTRGTSQGAPMTERYFVPIVIVGVLILVLSAVALLSLRSAGEGSKAPSRSEAKPAAAYPIQTTRSTTFAPTKAGAVAAATAFESRFIVLDLESEVVARDWAGSQAAKSFEGGMAELLDERLKNFENAPFRQAKEDGKEYFAKTWPVTYRVRSFSASRAVVTIWSSNVSAIERQASPRVSWTTDTITVQREDGTWKIADYRVDPPIVPYLSGADKATSDDDFYASQKGAEQYAVAP